MKAKPETRFNRFLIDGAENTPYLNICKFEPFC